MASQGRHCRSLYAKGLLVGLNARLLFSLLLKVCMDVMQRGHLIIPANENEMS